MKVSDILRTKGSAVVTVEPDRPIQDALRMLVEHNIGAMVVFEGGLQGIISERDVLRFAATDLKRLESAHVRDLMTRDVITATPETDIQHVMDIMTERGIRHLPVLNEGSLCGMISIRDVVNAVRQNVENENQHLHAYISGTPL
ncbi:MAG TPA: CBS domain-containing protein [Longimicrobiales bacterium]|nr:CBS domain-containing protein [Longimicrobiales bacterium]